MALRFIYVGFSFSHVRKHREKCLLNAKKNKKQIKKKTELK